MTVDHNSEPELIIPEWLAQEGFEEGDDLAEFDAFECDACRARGVSRVGLIEDATTVEGDWGNEYICPECTGRIE